MHGADCVEVFLSYNFNSKAPTELPRLNRGISGEFYSLAAFICLEKRCGEGLNSESSRRVPKD